jgi:beta-phosphoglucomutase
MNSSFGVIFDVDGVLVDSYEAHFRSWQLLCDERQMAMSQADFVATFGRTSREIISELWGDRFTSVDLISEVDDRKEVLYREILRDSFPAMDGATRLIDQLQTAGFRLAVGSSGPPDNVYLVLDHLGRRECFRGVVTGMDVQRGKPDPQVFLLGADRLELAPSECVVFEDAPVGVAAAHAAGMKCVAVASTGRIRDELQEAELVVDSLLDVDAEIVRRLLEG